MSPKIIFTKKKLDAIVRALKKQKRKIVFTNGCFDLLHIGHLRTLQTAKSLGDILMIGLNSDASVRNLKGKGRPLTPLAERAALLSALEMVDYVIPFTEVRPDRLIEIIQPALHVKGGDYTAQALPEAKLVASLGGKVKILHLVPGRSTTTLLRKVKTLL